MADRVDDECWHAMAYKRQILVSWKEDVMSSTWKCFRWNYDGTEKGCQFLGLTKRRHEHAGILEEAVTCRRNCVLCEKVVDCCVWLKNVKDLRNNIKHKGCMISLSWKDSSTGKCCGWSWDGTKNFDCCQLLYEQLFECQCKRNNGNNCCQFFG